SSRYRRRPPHPSGTPPEPGEESGSSSNHSPLLSLGGVAPPATGWSIIVKDDMRKRAILDCTTTKNQKELTLAPPSCTFMIPWVSKHHSSEKCQLHHLALRSRLPDKTCLLDL